MGLGTHLVEEGTRPLRQIAAGTLLQHRDVPVQDSQMAPHLVGGEPGVIADEVMPLSFGPGRAKGEGVIDRLPWGAAWRRPIEPGPCLAGGVSHVRSSDTKSIK